MSAGGARFYEASGAEPVGKRGIQTLVSAETVRSNTDCMGKKAKTPPDLAEVDAISGKGEGEASPELAPDESAGIEVKVSGSHILARRARPQ